MFRRTNLLLLVMLLASLLPVSVQPVAAQDSCLEVTTPNDELTSAVDIGSGGPICVDEHDAGRQALYRWIMPGSLAQQRWTITVSPVANGVSVIQLFDLEVDDSGEITGYNKLNLSSQSEIGEGAILEDILLPADTPLLIGVAFAGEASGDFRVSIEPGTDVPPMASEPENEAPDTAPVVQGAFALSGNTAETDDYLIWDVTETESARAWELKLETPANGMAALYLTDESGTEIGNWQLRERSLMTIPNFNLSPGRYTFRTVSSGGAEKAFYIFSMTDVGAIDPASEYEPDDRFELAHQLTLNSDSTVFTGYLSKQQIPDEIDIYGLTITPEFAGRQLDIKVLWQDESQREVCLLDSEEVELRCISSSANVALNDLVLPEGDYFLLIEGETRRNPAYVVRLDFTLEATDGFETEPNDQQNLASVLLPSGSNYVGAGRLATIGESDYYKLTVAGEPQLWMFTVEGSGVESVSLITASGEAPKQQTVDPVTGSIVLYDIFLLPGDVWLKVTGSGDLYSIDVTPLGPPDPLAEMEPNETSDRSQPILLNEERLGRLPDLSDRDVYRFAVQNNTLVRITLSVPDNAQHAFELSWQGDHVVNLRSTVPGEDLVWEGWIRIGDYQLALNTELASFDQYTLTIEPLDPFLQSQDLEPNDTEWLASPAEYGVAIHGVNQPTFGYSGDQDWYVFPALDAETQVLVKAPDVYGLYVSIYEPESGRFSSLGIEDTEDESEFLVLVPAGYPLLLGYSTTGGYEIGISLLDSSGQPVSGTPSTTANNDVSLSLDLGENAVAAYWLDSQLLNGTLTITNDGSSPVDLTLDSWTGNMRWQVTFQQSEVTVGAGETIEVPVSVQIAPDAWANRPILVAVRGTSENGFASAAAYVSAAGSAPPVNPAPVLPLPEALVGGLNVASTRLGGTSLDNNIADTLLNERIATGEGYQVNTFPFEFDLDLAGESPIPLAGIIIDPRSRDGVISDQLKDFEVEYSTDGVTFTPLLQGSLNGGQWEQGFVLDTPVEATHIRIRVLSGQVFGNDYAQFGEVKVIAEPGWVPDSVPTVTLDDGTTADAYTWDGGFNIADPNLGGHVVSAIPSSDSAEWQRDLLIEEERDLFVKLAPAAQIAVVIGFNDNRAALIDHITWQFILEQDAETRVEIVSVEVATESPVGPWETISSESVTVDASGLATFELNQPVWARFVRITYGDDREPSVEDTTKENSYLPDVVRIFEAPSDGTYLSILGQWGAMQPAGIYEQLVPSESVQIDEDAGNSQGEATVLPLGTTHTDTAWVGQDEDWYQIDMPGDSSFLTLTLTGFPSVDISAVLFDEDGAEVPVLMQSSDSTREVIISAELEAGATYYLRVTEPPTNVMFSFDTSGSIGNYAPIVYQAVNEYSSDVHKGEEQVNILPFGADLLLDTWSDEPYLLQSFINNYPRMDSSSDSDEAIIDSSTELSTQQGSKAIVLITDNETSPSGDQMLEEWPLLSQVQPTVFAIQIVSSGNNNPAQDIMQDWSMVNGGYYTYVLNQADLDVAFDRAATILRRPSLYSVTAEASQPPPTPTPEPTSTPEPTPTPEPSPTPAADGELVVLAPEVELGEPVTVAENVEVAIILDTSGSMLQGLEGTTRADVAKTALMDLVSTTIPAGTSVSLRTFGDTPDSCETNLVVPMQPLDPAAMTETIQNLPVVNLVRTPIGASLEAVADDLSDSPGPKIVVLVTDGEETCDGDPAAEIQKLIDSGIDVRVNIVGFALDDDALKQQFADWAEIGNGRYIDAGNAEELTKAVTESVLPVFDVIDANGVVVATGQVGGAAVNLAPGTYTVVVHSAPEIRIDDVVITSEQTTEVDIGT